MPVINLSLGKNSYKITVCNKAEIKLINAIKSQLKNNRLFVIFDANFYALHGEKLSKILSQQFKTFILVIPSGEKTKSEQEVSRIHRYLLAEKISRTDFILAVGGGVTTDIAGYTAATTLRGIRWGAVSTTLLGMVDAAIGGKTGINHKQGKNLIGAFWQPSFVHCDIQYLKTVSLREMNSGLGEIIKYGGLMGDEMIQLIDKYLAHSDIYNDRYLLRIIGKSAAYKAEIVSQDEKESGRRMYLNLGHTFGHAIENSLGYGKLRHGEAVILGLWAAVSLSQRQRTCSSNTLTKYNHLIDSAISLLPKYMIDKQKLVEALQLDKKRIDSKQKFVLLEKVGKPVIVDDIKKKHIEEVLEDMLFKYKTGATDV